MHDQSYESYPACRVLTFIYLVGWRHSELLPFCSFFYTLLTQVEAVIEVFFNTCSLKVKK